MAAIFQLGEATLSRPEDRMGSRQRGQSAKEGNALGRRLQFHTGPLQNPPHGLGLEVESSLDEPPMAAATNGHKLRGLKQLPHSLPALQVRSPAVVSLGCVPSGTWGAQPCPSSFQLLEAVHPPGLLAPSSALTAAPLHLSGPRLGDVSL